MGGALAEALADTGTQKAPPVPPRPSHIAGAEARTGGATEEPCHALPRDPDAQAVVCGDDSRVLSVFESVDYIDRHFAAHIQGITHHPLISERQVRRLLSSGAWPCTRTAQGRLGITVRDLCEIWTWKPRKTRAW